MCTAICDNLLFGRTLDLEYSYDESVVITPRHFPLKFRHGIDNCNHYAIIGTAHVANGYPLYYDAMNEAGLCAAALRFPHLACYYENDPQKINLASFELITWLLCNYKNAEDAKNALQAVNITNDSFAEKLPSTPLHWLVGDKKQAFVIESVKEGLKVYDNPFGVLTNAPDFPTQIRLLKQHGDRVPGDPSSTSRFIRIADTKCNTAPADGEIDTISRFFHMLGTVNQPDGLFKADNRRLRTVYTSCMDTENKIYYFTTYGCRKIRAVKMSTTSLYTEKLLIFPMQQKEEIDYLN